MAYAVLQTISFEDLNDLVHPQVKIYDFLLLSLFSVNYYYLAAVVLISYSVTNIFFHVFVNEAEGDGDTYEIVYIAVNQVVITLLLVNYLYNTEL